jgi:hypothetical protein
MWSTSRSLLDHIEAIINKSRHNPLKSQLHQPMFKFLSTTIGNLISQLPLMVSSLLSEVSPSTELPLPQLHRPLLNRTFHTRVKLCKITNSSRTLTDFSQHKLIITCRNKCLQIIYKVSHLLSSMECSKTQ